MFRRLLRDPLVHFLGVGALLFGIFALVGPSRTGGDSIVITQAAIAEMTRQQEALGGRPVTKDELAALIESRIRDEVFYREGLTMGLDSNDLVIERRVRQKYELIAEEDDAAEPSEADLEAYLRSHPERFRQPPVVAFTQIVIPADATGKTSPESLALLRKRLEAGADPLSIGQATQLPLRVDDMPLDLVARAFGGPFAESLLAIPVGSWQGPVSSSYGAHFVRLDRRTLKPTPQLQDVRSEVQREWENARRERTRAERFAQLRKQYRVVVETPAG
jgi:parvulin-like peptidyl-prolyl isomerase